MPELAVCHDLSYIILVTGELAQVDVESLQLFGAAATACKSHEDMVGDSGELKRTLRQLTG